MPPSYYRATPIDSSSSSASFRQIASSYLLNFRFEAGVTPLSSFQVAFGTCVAYLLIIWALKSWIKEKKQAFDLKKFVIIYNFTLSFLSGVLFFFLCRELLSIHSRTNFFQLFCDPVARNTKGVLIFCYYVNYLFKYVELADTVLLCLRGKDTPFIHVYHHFITLLLCWTQLTVQTCMQWVLISINLFVHIILYSYYALYEMKVDVSWKKYLTTIQILQFLLALLASVGAMLLRFAWEWTPRSWHLGAPCHGSWSGAVFGLAIIVSYLMLFVDLYQKKYKSDAAAAAARAKKFAASSGSAASSSTSAPPVPAFQSTFSPYCHTALPPSGLHMAAEALKQVPTLSNVEDAYATMRQSWLQHPLIQADRRRWCEHREQMKNATGGAASIESEAAVEDSVDSKPAASTLTQRRFGTNAARL